MKSGKRSQILSDLLFGIIYFAACNLVFWLVWLILSFVTSGIYNELYQRSGGDAREYMEKIRSVLCVLIYCVVLIFIYKSNPVERNRYIMSTFEKKVSFINELLSYAKKRLLTDIISYAVFLLPFLAAGLICNYDLPFIPTAYLAQYNLYLLVASPVLSYLVNIIVFALIMAVFVPFVRIFWNSKRLR